MTSSSPLSDLLLAVDVPACAHFRPLLRNVLTTGTVGVNAPLAEQLAHACALVLRPTDRIPLVPAFEGASKSPSEFMPEELDLLLSHVEGLCPELRARVHDLVWVTRRDASKAVLAIGDYQESARILASHARGGFYARDNLARAAAIAASMKKFDLVKEVMVTATDLLSDAASSESVRIPIARFLVDQEEGDPATIADLLRPLVEGHDAKAGAEDGGYNWDWLRGAWKLVADAERQAGREAQSAEALRARAETYPRQAEWLVSRGGGAMLGAHFLRDGIEAMRQIPGTNERQTELHGRLREVQRDVLSEMKHYEGPSIDLTNAAHGAMDAVSGLTFREALFTLVHLVPIESTAKVREHAEERAAQSPLMFLISRAVLDADGRLVRLVPGGRFDDPASGEAALRAEMIRVVDDRRGPIVTALINPARRQIAAEHPALLGDWLEVLVDSPIVDRSRMLTWIRGLDAGLRGDIITSSYILVPQIEQSLRMMLAHTGVRTEWISSGVQKYKILNSILAEPALKELLGETLHFEIDALIGSEGQNFRNVLLHGLFSDAAAGSVEGVYLWHLALRILLVPVILAEAARTGDGESNESNSNSG